MDFIIVAAVFLACIFIGKLATKINFPSVLLEIALGLFAVGPLVGPQAGPIAFESVYWLGIMGLALYMFATGYELDFQFSKNRASIIISLGGIVLPFIGGVMLAGLFFSDPTMIGEHATPFIYKIFLGSALSITAFPILARLVRQEKLVDSQLGATLLGAAAIDDAFAWILLSLCLALVGKGGPVWISIAAAVLLPVIFFKGVKPLVEAVWPRLGRQGQSWFLLILLAVSITISHHTGLHYVFGAFLLGAAWPKNLTDNHFKAINRAGLLLVPFFFVYSGMKADLGSFFRFDSISTTLLVLLVACAGKIVGCGGAAALQGNGWRNSLIIGVMMNTRALMELILINIALAAGVISPKLFTMLAFMAIVTTYMPKPLLSVLRKKEEPIPFSTPAWSGE